FHGFIPEVHGGRDKAAIEGRAHFVPQVGRRQVCRVPRRPARVVPERDGQDAARRAGTDESPIRDAAVAKGARDAPPRAAHDDPAHARSGAAPHAADAGADGADGGCGRDSGPAVRFAFATAMVLVAAAGVFGQSNTPPITHDYAEVNGVRLHYAKAGAGPL